MVVFFHNFKFTNYFGFGWLGVDLFFVLSGYLISTILLNTVNESNFLKRFYIRRILRIFPLYYLVLIIALFVMPLLPGIKIKSDFYWEHQWWFWLFLQNWLFAL